MQLSMSKAICCLKEERESAPSTFSRTEVILQIVIALDFKDLFPGRTFFLFFLFYLFIFIAILSVE